MDFFHSSVSASKTKQSEVGLPPEYISLPPISTGLLSITVKPKLVTGQQGNVVHESYFGLYLKTKHGTSPLLTIPPPT